MTYHVMALAQFDILESKVSGLLKLHRELVAENRKLRKRLEEQGRELAGIRQQEEQTRLIKKNLLERIDKLLEHVGE
jgi:hypothetical protein